MPVNVWCDVTVFRATLCVCGAGTSTLSVRLTAFQNSPRLLGRLVRPKLRRAGKKPAPTYSLCQHPQTMEVQLLKVAVVMTLRMGGGKGSS